MPAGHRFALGTRVEQVFAEIAAAVEVGLYVYQVVDPLDPGTLRLVYANPAAALATGVEFAKIIGQPIRDAFPGVMETALPDIYLEIAQGGAAREIVDVAYGGARLDPRVFCVRAFPLPHASVGVSFTNMTAQRLAEQRAIQTMESMSDAFFTLDHEWRFTYINPQSELILGRRREELVTRTIWEMFPESVGSTFEAEYVRAVRDQVPVAFIETFAPLGRTFEVRAYPIESGLGVYYRDVTRELFVEAQLRQTQRMEALGRVTSSVAHDFNNLITAIRGFATLGQTDSHDAERASQYFAQIDSAGERAAKLTRQLLAVGREQELSPTICDLNDTVSGLATLLRHLLPPAVQLALRLDSEPVPVYVDQAQLEQVVLNLVVNSRDAIGRSGSITIRTSRHAPEGSEGLAAVPGDAGWLQVVDDGSGIPVEVLPHIFEPFYTTKAPETGTGLGLATIHGIVTQSKGDIHAKSAPGEGTTMTVVLPAGGNSATGRAFADSP